MSGAFDAAAQAAFTLGGPVALLKLVALEHRAATCPLCKGHAGKWTWNRQRARSAWLACMFCAGKGHVGPDLANARLADIAVAQGEA